MWHKSIEVKMLWMINRQQKHIEALLYQTWHQLYVCGCVCTISRHTSLSLARQFYLQVWGLCVTYCMSTQTHSHTHTILTIIMSVTAFLFFSLSILNTAWLSSSYQGLLLVLFSQRSRQSLVSEREKDQPNNKRHWNLFFHKHVLLWKERRKKKLLSKSLHIEGQQGSALWYANVQPNES